MVHHPALPVCVEIPEGAFRIQGAVEHTLGARYAEARI